MIRADQMPTALFDANSSPASEGAETEPLLAALNQALITFRKEKSSNPFSNAVQLLAIDIKRRLDRKDLSIAALERLIQHLTLESFTRRADRLRNYLGEVDREHNMASLRKLVMGLAGHGEDDAKGTTPVAFETFRQRVERELFGIVITAHPTFSLASDLQAILVELALGQAGETREALLDRARKAEHCPDQPLDLDEEHKQSLTAIGHMHAALHDIYSLVFEVAESIYPDRWTELNPRLLTIASWVGYDLDGRSDIPWPVTIAKRLKVQLLQLQRYEKEARELRMHADDVSGAGDVLELLEARLALAIKRAQDEVQVFEIRSDQAEDKGWHSRLAQAARSMHQSRKNRLVDAMQLIDLIERALQRTNDLLLRRGLCVLRAEIKTHGLGLAHTHTRLNARQLHNAVRKTIRMDHSPDDPSHRLTYLNAIGKLIDEVQPARINFGSLLQEKATAKRVFMIIAQILKYLDATQPVRFLIAECETGFTLLTALYFAKLFGVEDKVEISPLLETKAALEQGDRLIAEVLETESYRSYVRKQGRLCIQTGFSDAGRAVGQIAAAYAIERLRLRIGRTLAAHGLSDVVLVIFDTHGEAIGRGAHPGSFQDRLAYVDTAYSRSEFKRQGIIHKQEVSYQGGDGYQYFRTADSTFAVFTRIFEHCLQPLDPTPDPFYSEVDYIQEFFSVIQRFNEEIMDDPSYGALLGAYGANLVYPTGSRPLKRQHDSWSGHINLEHPAQLRAIPHNAILQQLGFLANSIGGVGQAVAKDPTRFRKLYQTSDRFRRLMTLVEHAFKFSDLAVLKAYIDLFDPGHWLIQAARIDDNAEQVEALGTLAAVMERAGLHERLIRIWRRFSRDYVELSAALREHRQRVRDAGEAPIAIDAASRDIMHELHAVRLALIQSLYLLAIQVPEFSVRHDLTPESLMARLIQLDIDSMLPLLFQIFPVVEQGDAHEDFGEPASYESAETQSYGELHEQIFMPIARLYRLVQQVSSAIVHNVGAIG